MATPIGGLRVDLQLSSAAFIRDIAKTNAAIATSTRGMQTSLTGLQKTVGSLNATFLGFLTLRTIRRVVAFTESCLKLATTIKGPLGSAAKDFQDKATAFENSFKLGVAQGFMDAINQGLKGANVSFEDLAKAGILLGNVLGGIFTTIVNFFTHDIPEGVKTSIASINSFSASVNSAISGFNSLNEAANKSAVGRALGFSPTEGNIPSIPMIDAGAIESSIGTWVDFSQAVNVAGASLQTTAEGQRQMNAAAQNFASLASLSNAAFEEAQTPMEEYASTVERLNFLLKEGGISAQTYGRLNVMAAASAVSPWMEVADTIGGALGTMFKENKAVAIAQAVINTAQAITKSLAEFGFTPIGIAAAAAAAIAGAAQIATIMSAQPGSSRALKSPKGGSASSSAGSSSRSSGGSQQQSVNIVIQGESFGPEHFKKLVAGLNGVIADGARLNVSGR